MLSLSLPVAAVHQASPLSGCLKQFDDFIEACNDPKKAHLASLQASVKAAYAAYVAGLSSLASLTPCFKRGTADGDRLFDCYESGAGVDRHILAEVQRVACGHCPYCGLRMRPKPKSRSPDRDHFLPRSVFPEFSVFSINLVLCCDDCNTEKGARFRDAAGRELFLHPYFDRVLRTQVLQAQAQMRGGTLQVVFSVDTTRIAANDVGRVLRHVEALGILDRMADEADEQLRVPLSALVVGPKNIGQMRIELSRLAREELGARPNSPTGLGLQAVSAMTNLDDVWNLVRDRQILLAS